MPLNPSLLTSGGTFSQISVLDFGVVLPPEVTITVTSAASVEDTTLAVTVSPTTATLYAGLVFKINSAPDEMWVEVSETMAGTGTSLKVEPITKAISANEEAKTYAAFPLIGLESASMQKQAEANSVVLLANGGYTVRDYSTRSFDFSGTLYVPTTNELAVGAHAVTDALLAAKNVYFERVLPDGTYNAGLCMVQSASDTAQGSQYLSQSVTFAGSGIPVHQRLNAA